MKHKSLSRKIFLVFDYALITLIIFICIIPVWHVLMGSFSQPNLLESNAKLLLKPLGDLTLVGYRYILNYKNIWAGYRNTIIYTVLQCTITGLLTLFAGYVLSRKRFKYRNGIMAFIAFTMLFNGGMIPTYMVIRELHILNTPLALLLPNAMNVMYIIIMRTGIETIPESLEESARLDGAGELDIAFKIMLPLSKASFAVIILFTAVMKWNEWYPALLYISDKSLYPLQMFLREILTMNKDITSGTDMLSSMSNYKVIIQYCSIVVATVPILCVYPFVQKHFEKGMLIGSIKG